MRAVDRLHARIPAAVFGGDLLETLSSTLRRHIITPDQPGPEASERTQARLTPSVRPTSSPGRRLESSAGRSTSRRASDDRPSAVARAGREPITDGKPRANRQHRGFELTPTEITAEVDDAARVRPEPGTNNPFTVPESAARDAAKPSSHPMTSSLLGRRISEYVTLAREDARRRIAESIGTGESRSEVVPSPVPSPHPRLAWSERLPEGAVDALQKFGTADARTPVPSPGGRPQAPGAVAPRGASPWRGESEDGGALDSVRDLSTQMAEILRQQALRHGIDLT